MKLGELLPYIRGTLTIADPDYIIATYREPYYIVKEPWYDPDIMVLELGGADDGEVIVTIEK